MDFITVVLVLLKL